MLIKSCVYLISILISIFSVISLVFSIKNKNKHLCKWIIGINISYVLYLLAMYLVLDFLYIPVGLEILYLNFLVIISIILYFISIIINVNKKKKLRSGIKNNKIILIPVLLILMPVFFTLFFTFENKKIISDSNLIVVYKSSGNGGFGDIKNFAYSINNDRCIEFDLGIDLGSYSLKRFLPRNAIEISNINELDEYTITFSEEKNISSIIVYKNNNKICQVKNKSHYYNLDFDRAFYINK